MRDFTQDRCPVRTIIHIVMVLTGVLTLSQAAEANSLPVPSGAVVLTMTEAGGGAQDRPTIRLDLETLRSLPAERYRTGTIWTDGPHTFEGVLLRDLLRAAGASGTRVRAIALNDYAIDIPLDEETTDAALVAYALDGHPMSVRDKGPLWIVYPYDSDAAYRSEVIYTRSIWQLSELEILD